MLWDSQSYSYYWALMDIVPGGTTPCDSLDGSWLRLWDHGLYCTGAHVLWDRKIYEALRYTLREEIQGDNGAWCHTNWDAAMEYQYGTLARFQGRIYRAQAYIAPNGENPTGGYPWSSQWDPTMNYDAGTEVQYTGRMYRARQYVTANLGAPSSATGSILWYGTWDASLSYNEGEYVEFDDQLYFALVDVSPGDPPPTSGGPWCGATWIPTVRYGRGAQVRYEGCVYCALVGNKGVGVKNAATWTITWESAQSYAAGQWVTYIGRQYCALRDVVAGGSAPNRGCPWVSNWDDSVTYLRDALVRWNDLLWCAKGFLDRNLGEPGSNDYWLM